MAVVVVCFDSCVLSEIPSHIPPYPPHLTSSNIPPSPSVTAYTEDKGYLWSTPSSGHTLHDKQTLEQKTLADAAALAAVIEGQDGQEGQNGGQFDRRAGSDGVMRHGVNGGPGDVSRKKRVETELMERQRRKSEAIRARRMDQVNQHRSIATSHFLLFFSVPSTSLLFRSLIFTCMHSSPAPIQCTTTENANNKKMPNSTPTTSTVLLMKEMEGHVVGVMGVWRQRANEQWRVF